MKELQAWSMENSTKKKSEKQYQISIIYYLFIISLTHGIKKTWYL